MNFRIALNGLLATVGLSMAVSCASTGHGIQIEDLSKIQDGTKAYLVAKIDNQTGKELFSTKAQPSLHVDKAFMNDDVGVTLVPKNDSPYLVCEVDAGTYRFGDVQAISGRVIITYTFDRAFYNYFKIQPGEVVYLGTFTLKAKNDDVTVGYDLAKFKDELVAKFPMFEGFHWLTPIEDRPSF